MQTLAFTPDETWTFDDAAEREEIEPLAKWADRMPAHSRPSGDSQYTQRISTTKAAFLDTCGLTYLWLEMEDKWAVCSAKSASLASRPARSTIVDAEDLQPASAGLAEQFRILSGRWKSETRTSSSVSAMAMHPAYLDIIGMGRDAVPYILRDLEKETSHWFTALRAITKASPVKPKDAGNLKKMREAWLKWGRENGFLD